MSVEVVKNVVQMVFDNGSFEQNAGVTLQTLAKLKDALNFEGAARGLENLGGSIKNTSMDALYSGVSKVQEGFNALDVVATRVLQNITDKVQGVAENLVKEITVAPLKSGLEEYETQINSVQTILANTNDALIENGLTTEHDRIEKVNSVLDELNQYADMTIYNFTEMTKNIGTFTAAGVELDTAATSIKGIANLAAMSGSNSQQASTAMYQLSQAIAAGSVKLQDWNSVVNAGMGGKLFQNELIDTAKAMGVADEQFTALTQGATTFRESLSSGWISAEVLTNTLEKFTAGSEGYTKSQVKQMREMWEARGYSKTMIDEMTSSLKVLTDEEEKNLRTKWAEKGFSDEQIDHILSMGTAATDAATKVKTFSQLIDTLKEALQSGWTQSWEYIIGDFEQAKRLWTEISDILNMYIGKSADSRNAMLAEWSKAAYSYNEAGELIYAADGKVVKGGKMVADEMGGREAVIQSLRNTFQGLLEIGVQFREAWDWYFWGKDTKGNNNPLADMSMNGQKLIAMSKDLLKFTEDFKNSLTFDEAGKATGILGELRKAFEWFAESARRSFLGVKDVFSGIGNVLKGFFKSDIFSIDTLNSVLTMFSGISGRIKDFGQAIQKHFGGNSNLDGIIKFFNGLKDVFTEQVFLKFDSFVFAFDAFGSVIEHLISPFGTFSNLLGTIGEKLSSFANAFSEMLMNEDVSEIEILFESISSGFNNFIDTIKDSVDFSGFTKFFNNIIEIMSSDKIKPFQIFGDVIEGLFNILKSFIGIASPVAAAFANVFGDWLFNGVDILKELASRFKAFTESLIPNAEMMSGLQHLFEGIFKVLTAVADVVGNVLLAAWDGLKEIVSSFLPDGKTFTDTLNDWGDKLTDVSEVIKSLVSGEDGVPKLSDIIGRITDKFIGFFGSLKDVNLLEKVSNLFKAIGDGIKHALGGTEDMTLLDTVLDGIKGFLQRLKDILSDENGELDFVKVLEAGGIGVVIKKLVDLFKELKEGTGDFKGFLGVFSQIGDAFEELAGSLGEKFKVDSIKNIATALLEIAAALFIIAMIDPTALATAIATVAAMFKLIDNLLLSLKTFGKSDAAILAAIAGVIQTLGNAILMMAGAIAIIGNMEIADTVKGLIAIAVMMQMMVKVVKELGKVEGSLPKVAGTLIGLAIALNLLIIPIKILGGMDLLSLAKGLGAVALMMAGLVGAAIALSKWGKSFKASTALGLIMMAESIKILASAVVMVKDIPWQDLAKGLTVMAAALIGMVGATAIIAKAHLGDDMMMLGASLLMLGTAMMMLTSSAKGLAGISWEDLGKLAAVLAGALVALGVAAAVINGPNLFLIGSGILMVAQALALLVGTLMAAQVLGPICAGIGAGLQGIADSLTSFAHHAAAQAFLQFLKDAILFLPQLAVALASALIEMVVTLGNGAAKIVAAVVNLGKAILQGIRQLLPEIGATILEFLVQIAEIFINFVTQEAPRFFEALTVFFDQLWTFLTGQIPNFFNWLTTLFTELFVFLQTEGPLLVETISLLIDTILQAIIAEMPRIGETLFALLQTLLTFIQTSIPEITNTLLTLLLTLLQQLATFVPQMAQAAMDILLGFLNAVAENIGQITESAISIAIAFMNGITEKMPEIVDSAFKMLIGFIDGLATAIDENHDALFNAIGHLIQSIVEAIIDGITDIANAAGKWLTGEDGNGGILGAIGGFVKDIMDAGANLVQGFIDGLTSMPGKIWDAACSLANDAWRAITHTLDEHSPSRLTYGGGKNFVLGLINGINDYASMAADSSASMAYGMISAFDDGINSQIDSFTPTIAPVFDDSGVQNGIVGYLGDVNNTISGTAQISGTIEATNQLKSKIADLAASENDYSDILTCMNGLRSDINLLGDQMSKMQIFMDSGVLVGAIANDMDRALGSRVSQTMRGVF